MAEIPFSKKAPRLIRRVEVFGYGANFSGKPKFLVERDEASSLIDDGLARRISKYKIALTAKGENAIKARTIQLRDESCSPTLATMERYVQGNSGAQAIIEAHAPIFMGSYCPLIPRTA